MERYDPMVLTAERRDEIIFGETFIPHSYVGGIRKFKINSSTYQQLYREGYINPEDKHNEAPSLKEIYDYTIKYPQLELGGYVVSPYREDYRISVHEIFCFRDITEEIVSLFNSEFSTADELIIGEHALRAWWD